MRDNGMKIREQVDYIKLLYKHDKWVCAYNTIPGKPGFQSAMNADLILG